MRVYTPLYTILIAVFCLLIPLNPNAQIQIKGEVTDAETQEPLAFVYILALGQEKGVFSDVDGRFVLELQQADSVRFSMLGYEKQLLYFDKSQARAIKLIQGGMQLEDVVIVPGENPALRIIRNTLENKVFNDPQQFPEYSFDSYNKLKFWPQRDTTKGDTTEPLEIIFETVSQKDYIRPGREKEVILASRLSGYPNRGFPLSGSDLQTISFYENYIQVLTSKFLSPISQEGLRKYRFTLVDTLEFGQDSIFTIAFEPKTKSFNGFSGTVNILSGTWPIVNIKAELVISEMELLLEKGRIQQIYILTADSVWFPSQQHTDVTLKPMTGEGSGQMELLGRSWMQNFQLKSRLSKREFGSDKIEMNLDAPGNDSILALYRPEALSEVENRSYQVLDSIGKKYKLPLFFDQIYKVADGKFKIGFVDLDLLRVAVGTGIDRWRPGLGLYTNENISRRFSLGGWWGYGIHDKQHKYMAALDLSPLANDRWVMGIRYGKDLLESGAKRIGALPAIQPENDRFNITLLRNYYISVMDYSQGIEAFSVVKFPANVALKASYSRKSLTPGYSYNYKGDSLFNLEEAALALRFAPGEEFSSDGLNRIRTNTVGPVFNVRWQRGFQTSFGEYRYDRFDFSLDHRFLGIRKSIFRYRLNIGTQLSPTPLSRMYVFTGNLAPKNYSDPGFVFNTMNYNEFTADQYAEGFFVFRPRLPWLGIGRWKPQLSFLGSAAWGQLLPGTASDHESQVISAPEKGFFEAGIRIQNLLPESKKSSLYGVYLKVIGIGAYYRMGPYAFPDWKQNFSFRISFAFL